MHTYNTRNKNNCWVATKNKKITKNALEFNKLPHPIKTVPNLDNFKKMLKDNLMGLNSWGITV